MEEGKQSAHQLRDQVDRLEHARQKDLSTLRELEAELRTQNDSFQKQGQPLLPCTRVHARTHMRARAHTHTHQHESSAHQATLHPVLMPHTHTRERERYVCGNIDAQRRAAEDWKAVSSSFEEQLGQWQQSSSEVSQHLITSWASRLALDQPVIIFMLTSQSS